MNGPPALAIRGHAAVVFDCDGVLVDSNSLKVVAFRDTAIESGFSPDAVHRFSEWQSRNFGLTRQVLFERLLRGEFGGAPHGASLTSLLEVFARKVEEGYRTAPETDGARRLIRALEGTPLYVVSASDERHLRQMFEDRGLASSFRGIYGASDTKVAHLKRILLNAGRGGRVLFIGDSMLDADAALAVDVTFIYMSKHSLVHEAMHARALSGEFTEIETLNDLLSPEVAL